MINSELERLKEWLKSYKLSLNIDKTSSMIIGTESVLTNENGEKPLPIFTFNGNLFNKILN